MPFDIIGANFFLPLFSVRDPESMGVRLSFLLPPPRTLLGALARSLGIIYGISSGEEKLKNEQARNILSYALEAHSFATIRPLSPLMKNSCILRYIPSIETGETIISPESAHDAFKTDLIISNEMKAIFFIDIEAFCSMVTKYDLPKIQLSEFSKATKFIDRIGPTEITCYTKNTEPLEIKEEGSSINSYTPYEWLENVEGQFTISNLLPNLLTLKILGIITHMDIDLLKKADLRRKKARYVLPLEIARASRSKEIYEPSEVKIKPRQGFVSYSLNDGTKVVLPDQKINV